MQILNDFNTTVRKALSEIDPDWEKYEGLIICGTHSPEKLDPDQQIGFIRMAREHKLPFLGICFGHQLAAIEHARNVLGIKDATSEEFGAGNLVVKKLPTLKVGLFDSESYWNNYEVIPDILAQWEKPENFITCQFHPEYQSSKDKPHPLLIKFLEICRNQKKI